MSLQDFAQKEGDADGTVAFRCFWRLDYLGPCDLDVILVDPQRMGLEIAVCRCEGQQFAQAQSRKKKRRKSYAEADILFIGQAAQEGLEFVKRPEGQVR